MGKVPSASEAALRMYIKLSRHYNTLGVAVIIPDDSHQAAAQALVETCADLELDESEVVIISHIDPSLVTGNRLDDGRYILLYTDPRRS